jgi:hypothetical protein
MNRYYNAHFYGGGEDEDLAHRIKDVLQHIKRTPKGHEDEVRWMAELHVLLSSFHWPTTLQWHAYEKGMGADKLTAEKHGESGEEERPSFIGVNVMGLAGKEVTSWTKLWYHRGFACDVCHEFSAGDPSSQEQRCNSLVKVQPKVHCKGEVRTVFVLCQT